MDTFMAQVIQQMSHEDSSDVQKESEITAAVKRYAEEFSNGQKSATTERQPRRSSSFSVFRSNVLQYVENGAWNVELPKTTTRTAVCSHEEGVSRKYHNKKKSKKDVSSDGEKTNDRSVSSKQSFPTVASLESHAAPVTNGPYKNDLHQLPLLDLDCSSFKDQPIQPNLVKFGKYSKQVSRNDDSHPSDFETDIDNSLSTYVVVFKRNSSERFNRILSSSSTDSTSSCEYSSDETGDFSCEEDPEVVTDENSVESSGDIDRNSSAHALIINTDEMPQNDVEDGSRSKEDDSRPNSSDTDGLSTYTLHSRWEELLPKEVVHRISGGNELNKKRPLFGNLEELNITIDSAGHLAYPMREISSTKKEKYSKDGITLGNGTVECNLENDDVSNKEHCFSSGKNNFFKVHEPPEKSNSIQDTYRSILKTISNVGDGTIQSVYAGKRTRRSRKAKTKAPPMFTCSKCKSSYFVSSKKAIAISRCMQCDLWTSVDNAETEEEEAPSSYCCLS